MDTTARQQFDAAIAEILADWGDVLADSTYRLIQALESLYRAELVFPPIWPEHRREAFTASWADRDGAELSEKFDDLIDVVVDQFGRKHGFRLHNEDANELTQIARLAAVDGFVADRILVELPYEMGYEAWVDPGRGEGSMTACSTGANRKRGKP